jgi:outer membrane cobalamin receptor
MNQLAFLDGISTETVMEQLERTHNCEARFSIEYGAFSYLSEHFFSRFTEDEQTEVNAAKSDCRRTYDNRGNDAGDESHNNSTSRLAAIRKQILNRFALFTRGYIDFHAACQPIREANEAAYENLAAAKAAHEKAGTTYRKTHSDTSRARYEKATERYDKAQVAWGKACADQTAAYKAMRHKHIPATFQLDLPERAA